MIAPAQALTNGKNKIVCLMSPTGSGKSALIETVTCYWVAVDSGNLLVLGQTAATSKEFVKSRLLKTLNASPPTRAIMETLGQYDVTQTSIDFPHMQAWFSPANETATQEKSCRYVIIDEAWRTDLPIIGEAERRTHRRYNSVMFLTSQAAETNHPFNVKCEQGDMHDFYWKCDCGEKHNWDLCFKEPYHMKYEEVKNNEGELIWKDTLETVRLECPACKKTYNDITRNRRKLSEGSEYISRGNNSEPEMITFSFPCQAMYREPWADTVKKWIKANQEKRKGNYEPLRQFVMKEQANTWHENETIEAKSLTVSDYTKEQAKEKFPNEVRRIMAADVNGTLDGLYHWTVIRAVFKGGESKLCWEGLVANEKDLIKLEEEYNVSPKSTFIDTGYEKDGMLDMCARNDWTGVDGRKPMDFYTHKTRGGTVKKYFSKAISVRGTYNRTYHADTMKDIVSRCKTGQGVSWLLPKDVSQTYAKHMRSEVKKDGAWKTIDERNNHLWDAECMAMVGMMICGLY